MATTPYDQFDATKTDSFWSCASDPCTLNPHQSNATLGVNDYLYILQRIGGKAQVTQFANKQVSFVWGFSTCAESINPAGASLVSQISAADTRGYQDAITVCPQKSTASHTGTTTLGSDGVLSILFLSQVNFGTPQYSYIGDFVLQITSTESDSTTSSSTSASTSSASNSETGTATSNGPSDIPLITAPWSSGASGPSPLDSSDASTHSGGGTSSSSTSQGAVIGGAAAGVVAAIAILVAVWILYRRKRRTAEMEEASITPLSRGGVAWERNRPEAANYVQGDSSKLPSSPHDIRRANEKNPEALTIAGNFNHPASLENNHNVSDTLRPDNPTSGRPVSAVLTASGPPAYDAPPNDNSDPLFAAAITDQQGPYTLNDTFQVHDLLGQWAEEHRDAVPYHLERRLRTGGYVPGIHPNDIRQEEWSSRFEVTRFELAGLVELFERTHGMPTDRSS